MGRTVKLSIIRTVDWSVHVKRILGYLRVSSEWSSIFENDILGERGKLQSEPNYTQEAFKSILMEKQYEQ